MEALVFVFGVDFRKVMAHSDPSFLPAGPCGRMGGMTMGSIKAVRGGVTAPQGYRAAAVEARIKHPRPDLAMLVSDVPAVAAGMFTTNRIQAAPVRLCRDRVRRGRAQAILVNSGCANACTGTHGWTDACRMATMAARALDIREPDMLVCSTGTIGIPMPMDRVEAAIPKLVDGLNRKGGDAAARAIMTTDTVDKQEALEFRVNGKTVRIGGMCKGAGMIEPNMATMLAFLTTDAAVAPGALKQALRDAVNRSFNRITVDGDQSTNDTILFLANGMAGNRVLKPGHPAWRLFCEAVQTICLRLACRLVKDGEGATRFVTVCVKGAASDADAQKATRAIANSLLVKTSWFGADPNWGRVIDAVGYSGARVEESKVDIRYDRLRAVRSGQKDARTPLSDLEKVLRQQSFTVEVDLHLGRGTDTVYTCDCSVEYIKINAAYMT